MLVSLKISSVLLVSTVPLTIDYKDYSKYKDYVISDFKQTTGVRYKNTLEYNTIDSQEYLESLIEKTYYSPIIKELENNDAR
jgi:hypothetical protein